MRALLVVLVVYGFDWITVNSVSGLTIGSLLDCCRRSAHLRVFLLWNFLEHLVLNKEICIFVLNRRLVRVIEDSPLASLLILIFQEVVVNHFLKIALFLGCILVAIIGRYCLVTWLRPSDAFRDHKLEIVPRLAAVEVLGVSRGSVPSQIIPP